jgi:hypothetical protein
VTEIWGAPIIVARRSAAPSQGLGSWFGYHTRSSAALHSGLYSGSPFGCFRAFRVAVTGLLFVALNACGSSKVPEPKRARPAAKGGQWGYFSGPVETRWLDDGVTMVLLNELRYTDPKGEVWIAPAGARVNGASIPRAFWSVIGAPFDGKYRNASVLHDVAYDEKTRPWQEVDRMFYNAMGGSGVGAITAKTMYYSLYRHGRHWKDPNRRAVPAEESSARASAVDPREVGEIQSWIRQNDPSLDQIEERAVSETQ